MMRHKVMLYTQNIKFVHNLESKDSLEFDYSLVSDSASLFDYKSAAYCMIIFDKDSFEGDFSEYFSYLKKDLHDIKMLVLSLKPDVAEGVQYLKEGVKGYGNALMHPVHLLQAVDVICEGNIWIYPELASYMIQQTPVSSNKVDALEMMDAREKEIIDFVCQGMRNRDIAQQFSLSEVSIKKALTQIYHKLHVADRVEMIAYFNR